MVRLDLLSKCNQIVSDILISSSEDELEITTDSRKIDNSNCFIALYGEHFDGYKFIESLLSTSLKYFIYENRGDRSEDILRWKSTFPDKEFIAVKNIFDFIKELATVRIDDFKEKGNCVVGITGSNGKTTNKEMITHLLGRIYNDEVWFTQGNLNNQIGVPLTIFALEKRHRVIVVEMGTSLKGEIEILSQIVKPQYGLITNIGHAHLENLKNLEGVFSEKSSLYFSMKKAMHKKWSFIINGADPYLNRLKDENNVEVLNNETFKEKINGFEIKIQDEWLKVENNELRGSHQLRNMGQCLLLCSKIVPNQVSELIKAANDFEFKNFKNRGALIEYKATPIYLDAYNANPDSMKASLNSYLEYLQQKEIAITESLIILGDMNELGEDSDELHIEVGSFAKSLGFKSALFIGRFAEHYVSGFGHAQTFSDALQVKAFFNEAVSQYKSIFIKGSRSLQLESIIDINN